MIVHLSAWAAFSKCPPPEDQQRSIPGKPTVYYLPRPDTVTVTFDDISQMADHPPGVNVPGGSQYDGLAVAAAGIGAARASRPVLA